MGSPMLNTALKAARAACTILNRAADNLSTLEVHKKGHSDFVSEADVACERAIVEVLREAYPRHQILGEENGVIGPQKSEFQWIIDPIDGTTNFLHGFPQYAVSIALKRGDEIIEAVVADPVKNEIFTEFFLATGLKAGDRHLDEGECLEVFRVPFKELLNMALNGEITDVKTLVGVFWLEKYLKGAICPQAC